METRNVTLTLEKAREWYNSDSSDLKEVALQAFTEEELSSTHYTDIKTFEDACLALGLSLDYDLQRLSQLKGELGKHLVAVYKLDIIRKALNKDWKPSLVEGRIYFPIVRFYPAGQKAREIASSNNWKLGDTFKAGSQKYTLVGGDYECCACAGLADFGSGYGDVLPFLGLLGCKSREIVEHMSRYFSKEIFEAAYAHHVGTYEWC